MKHVASNKMTGSTVANAIVILAIVVIPLMYGGLLTSTYQNPTNRVYTMKAAVVNLDSPADVELATGKNENFALGDELESRLVNPENGQDVGFTWVPMSASEAEDAIKNEEIRAVLTIPDGFTKGATAVGTKDAASTAAKQTIELTTDDGVNYLAGTLARTVAVTLEEQLTAQGAEMYVDNILVSLSTIRDGMVQAADGSSELAEGTNKLNSGLNEAKDGTSSAAEGAQQLADGAGQLAEGTTTASNGADTLSIGVKALADGASNLKTGVDAYTNGVNSLSSGASSLNDAVVAYSQGIDALHEKVVLDSPSLAEGAANAATGANLLSEAIGNGSDVPDPNSKPKNLVTAVKSLAAGTQQLSDSLSTEQAETSLTDLSAGATDLSTKLGTLYVDTCPDETSSDICGQLKDLATEATIVDGGVQGTVEKVGAMKVAVTNLNTGAQELSVGMETAAAGAASLDQGTAALTAAIGNATDSNSAGQQTVAGALNDLAAKSGELRTGANALDQGSAQLGSKSGELATGTQQIAEGASNASSGVENLDLGLSQLAPGANSLWTNTATLAEGLATLSSGVKTAADGSKTLADGSSKLSTSLQEGVSQIPNYSPTDAESISEVISEPVAVDAVRDNAVANNGAGFTPMFMSLALWIGGIAIFLVIPALDRRPGPREHWWEAALRPAVTATILAVIQAALLMIVTNYTVGLEAANMSGLVLMAIATSLTFVALNQMFVAVFAYRGRFISIVLLCLQITSMGATFPIETAPKFFQWIHPFLPMSYTQLAFRQMIAGSGATNAVPRALVVLVIYFAIAVTLTLIAAKVRVGDKPLPQDNALLGDSLQAAADADAAAAAVRLSIKDSGLSNGATA